MHGKQSNKSTHNEEERK